MTAGAATAVASTADTARYPSMRPPVGFVGHGASDCGGLARAVRRQGDRPLLISTLIALGVASPAPSATDVPRLAAPERRGMQPVNPARFPTPLEPLGCSRPGARPAMHSAATIRHGWSLTRRSTPRLGPALDRFREIPRRVPFFKQPRRCAWGLSTISSPTPFRDLRRGTGRRRQPDHQAAVAAKLQGVGR